jgi:hypothetical protein
MVRAASMPRASSVASAQRVACDPKKLHFSEQIFNSTLDRVRLTRIDVFVQSTEATRLHRAVDSDLF